VIWWFLGCAVYFFGMGFTANIFVGEAQFASDRQDPLWKVILMILFWPWPWGHLLVELIQQHRQMKKSEAQDEEERKRAQRSV
jgi:hypothetical protein